MPSINQLQQALTIAEKIQSLEEELATVLGGETTPRAAAPKAQSSGKRVVSEETRAKMVASQQARRTKSGSAGRATSGKRVVSDEARARISAAAKARHQRKNGSGAGAVKAIAKGTRVLSPEGRARIVAALKRRHAATRK